MYIWYISLYEPLPIDSFKTRMMRSGFISKYLYQAGHEVELWIPGFEHAQHRQFIEESTEAVSEYGFRVQYIQNIGYEKDVSFRRWYADIRCARELSRLMALRKRLPDVLITQIPSLKMAYEVTKFSVLHDIPVIVDIRDPWPDVFRRMFPRGLQSLYYAFFGSEIFRVKKILTNARGITAVSEMYLDWSKNYIIGHKTSHNKVFRIGYDDSLYRFHHEKQYLDRAREEDKLVAVYVGTFGSNLDIDTLIEVARIIDKNKDNIEIRIVGSGEGSERLCQAEKQYSCLSYLGWKNGDEISEIYMGSDVGLGIYPQSAQNTLTNKLFEYMAGSLPVVSTLSGYEPKYFIDSNSVGINCKAGETKEIYNALIVFLEKKKNGDLESIKVRCQQVLSEKYSLEKIYSEFVEFVEFVGMRR